MQSNKLVECQGGVYRYWQSEAGLELWFQCPGGRKAVGVTPFHRGRSRASMRIARAVTLPAGNPLEGAFMGTLMPAARGQPERPLVLEMTPFAVHAKAEWPAVGTVQIVAFAHAMWLSARGREGGGFASVRGRIEPGGFKSLAPGEVPELKLDEADNPASIGLMSGLVRELRQLRNPATGADYCWMLLQCDGLLVDVVADPVAAGMPNVREGLHVEIVATLIGRLAEPAMAANVVGLAEAHGVVAGGHGGTSAALEIDRQSNGRPRRRIVSN